MQNAIERLDFAYQNFFRTCHSGGGFPKFARKGRDKSILFKIVKLISGTTIKLPKIGELKLFKDAPMYGVPKIATIIKEPTGYFVCVVCDEVDKRSIIQNQDENQVCGIDMGISFFCADSNGNMIENPRHFLKYEKQLRIENRSLSRKKKGSKRWKKQARKLAMLQHRIANIRKDFLHKESTSLAKKYHTIFVEDLKIANMARNKNLSKHILDCGWGMFRTMLAYKTNVVLVNPRYTSQTCNECGKVDSKSRISRDEFECVSCGHVSHADVNAAKSVLVKGQKFLLDKETASAQAFATGEGIAINRESKAIAYALVEEPHVL